MSFAFMVTPPRVLPEGLGLPLQSLPSKTQ
jgi:hypothetical protein